MTLGNDLIHALEEFLTTGQYARVVNYNEGVRTVYEPCEKCGEAQINGECDCTYAYSDDYAEPIVESDLICVWKETINEEK